MPLKKPEKWTKMRVFGTFWANVDQNQKTKKFPTN
jgi:hypothetical protein